LVSALIKIELSPLPGFKIDEREARRCGGRRLDPQYLFLGEGNQPGIMKLRISKKFLDWTK
jgi:hypothetical protein